MYKKTDIYVHKIESMLTHIDIDEDKLREIMEFKGFKTKKEAVNAAIDEFLRSISAQELLKLKGSNIWDGDLDQMRTD